MQGKAYVIYGNVTLSDIDLAETDTTSPTYFSSSKGFRILGGAGGDNLGASVSGAVDVNRDGYNDVIVGAFSADPGGRSLAGEAYVIYGNTTLSDIDLAETDTTSAAYFSSSKGFRILGGVNEDRLGVSASGAGDVNADGYDDIIVGANGASPGGRSFAGETYIIYGVKEDVQLGDLTIVNSDVSSTVEATGNILSRGVADMTITGNLTAREAIDLNAISNSLTMNGAILYANGRLGIDLSDIPTLIFMNNNNCTSNAISLPSGFRISGPMPNFNVTPTYVTENGAYQITQNIEYAATATGNITSDNDPLMISADLTSTEGIIDLRASSSLACLSNPTISATTTSVIIVPAGTTGCIYADNSVVYLGGDFTIEDATVNADIQYSDEITTDSLSTLTVNNDIRSYDGDIDLSNVAELIFNDGVEMQVSSVNTISLPSGFRISGPTPTFSVTPTYATENGAYQITQNIEYTATATGNITSDNDPLMISANLTSTGGNIDLSNVVELTFNGGAEVEISSASAISLPSGFRISGSMPTFSVTPTYATENGAYQITQNIKYAATATGNITSDNDPLMISADLTSTEGIIDLRASSSLACLSNPTISATTTSVIIVPAGTTGCIYADNSVVYLGGDFTIEDATVNADIQYSDEITTDSLSTLTVNNDIRSYDGDIDLSNVAELIFNDGVEMQVSSVNAISLPSGFRISGPTPTFNVTPTYATENGAYQITQNIEYAATATGDIVSDNNPLMISANVTSTEGIIDLRASSSLACLSNPTISATTASVIIVPAGTTGCIYADNSVVYLGGDFTIENAIVNADLQYTDEIIATNLSTLTVNNDIRSYEGDIDLSNAVELIFGDGVTVEVNSANTITLPPMTSISGNPTYMGNVEYRSRGNTGGGTGGGGSDNGGSGSGSSGGNSEDSGSSGGTIAGAVIGSFVGIALIGFGFYRWHESTNNANVEDAGNVSEVEMESGSNIAGLDNGLYDEV